VPLYDPEYWALTKEQIIRMETAEMRFLRAVTGYRMIDGKHKLIKILQKNWG
jgi:hypothetical protein